MDCPHGEDRLSLVRALGYVATHRDHVRPPLEQRAGAIVEARGSGRFRNAISSRQTAHDRGPAGQLDPVAVGIEDHRYPRHASKCYRRKTLAYALASQIIMGSVDIGDLQGDVAPAECLTSRIDGRGAVFLQKKETVSQAKRQTARPGLFGEAEDVALEPTVFTETPDSHPDG